MNKADMQAKERQKRWKDRARNVTPHKIGVGDDVLLLQQAGKTKPRYDPMSYKVIKVIGTQITAKRGEKVMTRDAQKFKKVAITKAHNYQGERLIDGRQRDWYPPTIESGNGTTEAIGSEAGTPDDAARRDSGSASTDRREAVQHPSSAGEDTGETGGESRRPVRVRKAPAYLSDYLQD